MQNTPKNKSHHIYLLASPKVMINYL